MTRDKAHKAAVRRRMAETGEPYSVARRAVRADEGGDATSGPIRIRYWLSRSFELEIDRDAWNQANETARARLLADSDPAGSVGGTTTLTELIAADLAERGPSAFAEPQVHEPGARLPESGQQERAQRPDWEEQYYAEGAAAEGISVAEFKARQEYRRDMGWPGRRKAAQAPGQAQEEGRDEQERDEHAIARADEAQEHAERAQGEADLAQQRADEARDRADEAADRISEADDMAEEAMAVGDHELQAAADRMREQAVRAAERAEREAVRAQELADREQERADREQERADRELERADRELEKADRAWEQTEAAMSRLRDAVRRPGRRGLPPLAPLSPAPPMPPRAPRPRH